MSEKDLIAFEISRELLKQVDEEASKTERTRSAMLRLIIKDYFKKSNAKKGN